MQVNPKNCEIHSNWKLWDQCEPRVQHEGGMRTASNGRGRFTCSHDSSSPHREQLIGYLPPWPLHILPTVSWVACDLSLFVCVPLWPIPWHHRRSMLFGSKQLSKPCQCDKFYESLLSSFNVAWWNHNMLPPWKLLTPLLTASLWTSAEWRRTNPLYIKAPRQLSWTLY